VVVYVGVLILAPVLALLVGALQGGPGPIFATFGDADAQAAFGLTLQIALITVVVNGLLGTITAWVLTRQRFPGRRLLNALVDLPFAMSPVVVGFVLILIFGRLGPLATLQDNLNIQVAFAVPGMVLATVFVTLPFMIRELMPVIAALDREQEHAAATLGASGWQTFLFVTLPALRWGILYGLVLTFARALGEFGAVLVVGGDIQGSTETAPLYIFRVLDDRNYAAAYSVALALGLISLALVLGIEQLRKRERRA
jgi:sulfate transport system permease protein